MSISKDGDGRRNNVPPQEHRIKPGEVRNPDGRRGKQKPGPISKVDQFMLEEAERIVSRDEQGRVSAARRLVQEEYKAALVEGDPKVRERLLRQLSSVQAKAADEEREAMEFVLLCKAKYEPLFHNAQVRGLPPPDVAHPTHVHFRDGKFVFTGPLDAVSRKEWEEHKSYIKICAWLHAEARERFKADPSDDNLRELKRLEAHRRRLMRCVPEGWDWRENIYCRHSRTKFVEETIAWLRSNK
jgi:hypothetical protein